MRFAHIADVHLGYRPDRGAFWEDDAYREIYDGFSSFVDYLELHPVDFIFITGDLFDHVPSRKEIFFADNLLAKLKETNIIYVTGRHDYLRRGADLWNYRFLSNMYVLNGEPFQNHIKQEELAERTKYADGLADCIYFPEFNLDIYGVCRYSENNESRELENIYARDLSRMNIMLAYGGEDGGFDFEDMKNRNFKYIGMGGLHGYTEYRSCNVFYPGSPEPLSAEETGTHGFIRGYIDDFISDIKLVPLSFREYEKQDITVDETTTDMELIHRISGICRENRGHIYNIRLIRSENCYVDFDLDMLMKKYRILSIEGARYPRVGPDKLELLNADNILGQSLCRIRRADTLYSKEAQLRYAEEMTKKLWGSRNLGMKIQAADYSEALRAHRELEEEWKAELKLLQEGLQVCETERENLLKKLAASPDTTGDMNTARDGEREIIFELEQLKFEDAQVNRKYDRKRLRFILFLVMPFVILFSLLVTIGVIDVFFLRAWRLWMKVLSILMVTIVLFSVLGYCLYNVTRELRAKLFKTETPAESHIRYGNLIAEQERKLAAVGTRLEGLRLDRQKHERLKAELRKVEERHEKLIVKFEIISLLFNNK